MTTVTMGMGKAKAAANGHARNGSQSGTRHGGREAGGQSGQQQQAANEARLPGTDIVSKWVYVTPELAEQYLASNGKNRSKMPSLAATYAKDMADGEWHVTHQGAGVCDDGHLADCQHRFEAIRLSGKAQWVLVTTGLPAAVREVIDRSRARSLAHALEIMGFEMYDNRAVAMARSMLVGPGHRPVGEKVTAVGMRKFMEHNSNALQGVMALPEYRDKGINLPAGITGLLARAYVHVGAEELARFTAAMADAVPADRLRPGDRSARMLMGVLQKRSRAGGHDSRVVLYRKAQRALRSYLDGVDLTKMHEEDDDLFPLPAVPAGEAGGD